MKQKYRSSHLIHLTKYQKKFHYNPNLDKVEMVHIAQPLLSLGVILLLIGQEVLMFSTKVVKDLLLPMEIYIIQFYKKTLGKHLLIKTGIQFFKLVIFHRMI